MVGKVSFFFGVSFLGWLVLILAARYFSQICLLRASENFECYVDWMLGVFGLEISVGFPNCT